MVLRELSSRRRVVARLGQRAAAGLAGRGVGGRGRGADVAQPARLPTALDRDGRAAHGGRRGRDDGVGVVLLVHRGRALLVRPRAAAASARRCFAIAVIASLALPIAARGPARATAAAGRAARHGRRARRRRRGPRVSMLLLDGASLEYILPRVARRAAAEFRAAARQRRVDGSGDDPADAARSGVGGRRDGHVSRRRTACDRPRSYFAPRRPRPVDLLPDHCFSHVLVRLGVVRDEPNASAALARPAAVVDPRRLRPVRPASSAGR